MKNPRIPESVEDAVNAVIEAMDADDLAYIRAAKPSEFRAFGHMGLGVFLRNLWMWNGKATRLLRDAEKKYRITHPDNISGLILRWLYAKVNEIKFDPCDVIREYDIFYKQNRPWKCEPIDDGFEMSETVFFQ